MKTILRFFVCLFFENFLSPNKDDLQKVVFAWTRKIFKNFQKLIYT